MISPSREERKALWSLLGLFLFHAFLLTFWLKLDTHPPGWDEAVHLQVAWEYKEDILQGRWGELWRARSKPGHPPYPPLYHLSLVPALAFSSNPEDAAARMNLFYLAVVLLSLYPIATYFFLSFN